MDRKKWVGSERWVFDGGKWIGPQERGERGPIRSFRDLEVYNLRYTLAMEIFLVSTDFPKQEQYSLVDQMRRLSRAVCAILAEGFAKRRHKKVFQNALNGSLGESAETAVWLDFSLDCDYISPEIHQQLSMGYNHTGAMLWTLMTRWESYQ